MPLERPYPTKSCLSFLNKFIFFFFNDTATTEIYTLSLHDALPIYWLARSSLMAEGALVRVPLQYAPLPPGLENYILAFGRIDLGRAVLNSALVSIGACVLSLALVLVAAYGMSRFRFRGRSLLLLLLVATQLIPQIMLLVPL